MLASALHRLFAPAAALMARLTYARKFALIGIVLLGPAAIALACVLGPAGRPDRVLGQGARRRRGARAGERARRPARHARSLAVPRRDGRPAPPRPRCRAAVSAASDERRRDQAPTEPPAPSTSGRRQSGARPSRSSRSAAAAKPKSGQAAFDAVEPRDRRRDRPRSTQIANGSNLILDPDLDSFYLMDAVITKLPALADTAGQTADLQRIVAVDGAIAGRIALAGAQGTMASTAARDEGRLQDVLHAHRRSEPALARRAARDDARHDRRARAQRRPDRHGRVDNAVAPPRRPGDCRPRPRSRRPRRRGSTR